MTRFAMVECATYNDPRVEDLTAEAKLLFLWSWTNPNAAICGLYHVSERTMLNVLGRSALTGERYDVDKLRDVLLELARKPLLLYDPESEVMWVINRVRYANRSPKVARAMQREVEECPASHLVDKFVARYGDALDLQMKEES